MTQKQKAEKFDALMDSMFDKKKIYYDRMIEANDRLNDERHNEYVMGFNAGMRTVYEIAVQDLERWTK